VGSSVPAVMVTGVSVSCPSQFEVTAYPVFRVDHEAWTTLHIRIDTRTVENPIVNSLLFIL